MELYYIESGVHRAVAAREAGLTELPARLYVPNSPVLELDVSLASLRSKRRTITRRITRRRDLPGLIRAMADPVTREKVPRIELQRFGEFAQPKTIPLADVVITNANDEEDVA